MHATRRWQKSIDQSGIRYSDNESLIFSFYAFLKIRPKKHARVVRRRQDEGAVARARIVLLEAALGMRAH